MNLFRPARRAALNYAEYNRNYPRVAEKIIQDIAQVTKLFEVEHIGSTAVPGAGGKGIIDLMALYPEGALEETKEVLLSLGFCKQGKDFTYLWPERRPMYLGKYDFENETYMVYIHVIRNGCDEMRRFRVFRDRLKEKISLLIEYCDVKQTIIADGTKDTDEYAKSKIPIIKKILGPDFSTRK
jgi:GrpB-like predicted nucleotidyltransferase (UPF0157 family)